MPVHFNISVSGVVQGVFFRASTREQAQRLGLTGFVRNEPDGSVYSEVEGDADQVHKFIDWCKHGPPSAHVEKCEVSEGVVVGFRDFLIERR